jgi:hypothetical protein
MLAPVDALPRPESNGTPKRLGGVPAAPGVGVIELGVPMKLGCDGAAGDKGLGCEPKMLGGVPTVGAIPLGGVPTLPIELPGDAAMEGGVPTVGAPPGGAGAWPRAPIGGASKAAASTGAANVRCSMGFPSFLRQDMQGAFRPAGKTFQPGAGLNH